MSGGILLSFVRDCATAFLARIPSWFTDLDPGPIKSTIISVYRYFMFTIGFILALIRLALNIATFELYEYYYLGRTDFIIQFLSLYRTYTNYDYHNTEFGPVPLTIASLEMLKLHFAFTAAYVIIMLLVMLNSPHRLVSWPALHVNTDDNVPCSFVDEALLAGTRSPRPSLISCQVVSNAVNDVIRSPTVRAMIPQCLDPWFCGLISTIFLSTYRALKCAILRTPGFSVSYISMYISGVVLHLMYHVISLIQDTIFLRAARVTFGKEDHHENPLDHDIESPANSNEQSNVRTSNSTVHDTVDIIDEQRLVDVSVAGAFGLSTFGHHTE